MNALRLVQIDRRPLETPAARLRALAGRVRRLSIAGRLGTEESFVERDDVARELMALARELER